MLRGGCGRGSPENEENKPKPERQSRSRHSHQRARPAGGSRAKQEDPSAAPVPHPPQNSSRSRCALSGRPRCVHAHVFSSQPLNEVFAENLQFPHGLNLAKIAFLTLLGFNSNKPPLYYGTRSHCLDTARKSFIGKENGRREKRNQGREEEEEEDGETNKQQRLP